MTQQRLILGPRMKDNVKRFSANEHFSGGRQLDDKQPSFLPRASDIKHNGEFKRLRFQERMLRRQKRGCFSFSLVLINYETHG